MVGRRRNPVVTEASARRAARRRRPDAVERHHRQLQRDADKALKLAAAVRFEAAEKNRTDFDLFVRSRGFLGLRRTTPCALVASFETNIGRSSWTSEWDPPAVAVTLIYQCENGDFATSSHKPQAPVNMVERPRHLSRRQAFDLMYERGLLDS